MSVDIFRLVSMTAHIMLQYIAAVEIRRILSACRATTGSAKVVAAVRAIVVDSEVHGLVAPDTDGVRNLEENPCVTDILSCVLCGETDTLFTY